MPMPSKRRATRRLHCLLLGLLMAPLALANDPAGQQLRDQRQQLQRLEHEQRLRQWQRRGQVNDPTPVQPAEGSRQGCWPVSGVRLYGNRVLSAQVLDAPVQRQLRPCMDVQAINDLLKAITQRYVQAGYPTSRPQLLRRPSPGEPLDIRIVEGFVESIELTDYRQPLSLRGAFPGLLGEPLYLPDLEQGLDQLNRLAGFEVNIDLRPGELEGGTRVIVQPEQVARRWRLGTTYDNLGNAFLGAHRLNANVSVDSPFGQNGLFRLGVQKTTGDALGSSAGSDFHYDIPYGPWSLALTALRLDHRAVIRTPQHTLEGGHRFYQLKVERALWRNQQGMLSALASLDHNQISSRFDAALISNQSARLSSFELGANLLWLDHGLWNAYAGVRQGVDWLGADREPPKAAAYKPLHRTYRATLLHLRHGSAQRPWRWQSELSVQYSQDDLPGIDQLSLSGDTAVRGFRNYLHGASGAVWRNTFSYPLPVALPPGVEIRPQLGLDHGWTRETHKTPSERLTGAAAGITVTLPGAHLRLDYQQPLHASNAHRQALDSGYWVLQWALTL